MRLADKPDYEHGQCHILAAALHQLSGMPLMAALVEANDRVCLVHAWVEPEAGMALHARGVEPVPYALQWFPDGDDAWVEPITLDRLMELGEGSPAMTAALSARISAAGPLASLVLNPEQEIAGRVSAIRASTSSTNDEARRLAALADEIEAVFRELTPNVETLVAMLRWVPSATVWGPATAVC